VAAVSALPLIEAVQRAGGAIILHGDRLRLSAPEPLPEDLVQELRAHKAEVIDHLQHARGPKLAQPATDPLTDGTVPPVELVASWVAGVARLATMAPPRTYPAHAWQQLITDAGRFLDGWAQQAAALGWPDWALFGCHRHAPWGRVQGMGLVPLLHGRQLAALTAMEALVRKVVPHQDALTLAYRRSIASSSGSMPMACTPARVIRSGGGSSPRGAPR
jgi:TubC N-terminal docking domain